MLDVFGILSSLDASHIDQCTLITFHVFLSICSIALEVLFSNQSLGKGFRFKGENRISVFEILPHGVHTGRNSWNKLTAYDDPGFFPIDSRALQI